MFSVNCMFTDVWADVCLFSVAQRVFSLVWVTEKKRKHIFINRHTIESCIASQLKIFKGDLNIMSCEPCEHRSRF